MGKDKPLSRAKIAFPRPMDSKPNSWTARFLAILEIEKAPGKEGRGLLTENEEKPWAQLL